MPPITPELMLFAAIMLAAGVVRGFSGFGTALIAMPLGATVLPPATIIVALLVADTLPMLPILVPAARRVTLRTLLPVYGGYLVGLPLGIAVLLAMPLEPLRWLISAVVLAACLLLWSGWTWTGPRNHAVRATVGATSGLLGGSTGMNGPPVVLYWMSQESQSADVRANLIVFFALTELAGFALFWWNGLLTREALWAGAVVSPFYFIGLMAGARLFGRSSDSGYRRVTFLLILAAGILGLPALDGLIGR